MKPLDAAELVGGRYRLVRIISGRHGVTRYDAVLICIDRPVTLTIVEQHRLADDVQFRQFMKGVERLARFGHPNVAKIRDIGHERLTGNLFVVHDPLVGQDLHRHLAAHGRVPPRDAVRWMIAITEALIALHAWGRGHGDIRPENILLAQSDRGITPNLLGLEFSTPVPEDCGEETKDALVWRRMRYSLPSPVWMPAVSDARADLWSIGTLLYEMLAGRGPFEPPYPRALLQMIVFGRPTPLADTVTGLPRAVVDAVMLALDSREYECTLQGFLDALREASATLEVP